MGSETKVQTVDGQPVTDAQIQAWADEAEAGYPVEQLRRRGRPAKGDGPAAVVPVRMDPTLLGALEAVALAQNVTRSEAIRAAVSQYVDAQ
ncbi:ribbon-helix-helix domain-containing protein [Nocardioides alkalitolerans]|uniref:ribbon-helix-helix domain-containing protein n=1 Tax=Nocardioides alkalitolerans TaxID=281714 RepID=UPI0003FE47BB|nr:ribbon-helix-helix domain-containing protein [Nocardioides alkalitolerans]